GGARRHLGDRPHPARVARSRRRAAPRAPAHGPAVPRPHRSGADDAARAAARGGGRGAGRAAGLAGGLAHRRGGPLAPTIAPQRAAWGPPMGRGRELASGVLLWLHVGVLSPGASVGPAARSCRRPTV